MNRGALAGVRIGLDLDGTLMRTQSAFAAYLESALGRTVDPEPAVYDLAEAGWLASRDQFGAAWAAAVIEGLHARSQPYPGALEAIGQLRDAGVLVVVITARRALEVDATFAQLRRVGLVYDEIHFEPDKWTIPADVYLDDNPAVLAELDRRGLARLAAGRRYNEACGGPRFTSWAQVPDLVLGMLGAAAAA